MLAVLWGKKINQSSIQNAQIKRAVEEAGWLTFRNAVAVLAVIFCLQSNHSSAVTDDIIPFNISQQRADTALTQFAEQANLTLVFPFDQIKDHTANRLVGNYSAKAAINILLHNSGLTPMFSDRYVLNIAIENKGKRMNITKRKTLLATMVGFFAAGGAVGVQAQDDGASAQTKIDEIIVTATKRATSLQDTAMAITALSGETIDKRGLVGMGDYLTGVPGVTVGDLGAGQNAVVIRGVASNPQIDDSLTGIYFGETPLVNLQNYGGGSNGAVDIKMVDIDQVEVLRGPQGTLYGSSGMSGIVKITPAAPNLTEVEGKLATRFSQTGEEGGDNTMVQGILNVPLIEDTLAIRAVAYQFKNSGYVENVAASQPQPGDSASVGGVAIDRGDVGNDEVTGFRLAALWKPTEQLDMTLTYTTQDIEQDGTPDVNLLLDGQYQQRRYNIGEGGSRYEYLESEVDIVSLVANYDLGWGTLSSTTSQLDSDSGAGTDLSFGTDWLGLPYNPPYDLISTANYEVFTQELRFASQLGGPLEFVAGIYYEDFEATRLQEFNWSASGPRPDDIISFGLYTGTLPEMLSRFQFSDPTTQKAFFGELVYNFSEQLSLTLGGRYFDYERKNDAIYNYLQINLEDQVQPTNATDETGQSYKANLSYALTEDILIYGLWAEGFRLGSGQFENLECTDQGIDTPNRVDSDITENFELGLKTTFADGRATFNAAAYRINWQGIPVQIMPGEFCGFVVNVGEAIAEGVELELSTQLTDSFRLDLSASYGEATIAKDAELSSGGLVEKGDDLPGSADFNATLGAHYDFALAGYDSFARLDYTYMSEFYTTLDKSHPAAGGFGQFNIKTGIAFDQFAVDVFVNNLTNEDSLAWTDMSLSYRSHVQRANRLRPRTMGVNLSYQF
ncbi:TonB-dependent receptor [Porticoccaceae bacterium]|nr:TonB-dependent receptor [Porticoccaceae bacterium]